MASSRLALVSLFTAAAIGCGASAAVEKLPIGADVQVTRQDGAVVQGKLVDRDNDALIMAQGAVRRTVARRDIAEARVIDAANPASLPARARFREYSIPEGTALALKLQSSVASDGSRVEDPVDATLVEPVRIGDEAVLPAGAVVHGTVAEARPSGKVQGRASLAVVFSSIAAGGERYPIDVRLQEVAPGTKGEDAEKIAIPGAGGAVIGALVGGKKGAAVGAAIGAGAGTAVVLSTSGKEVRWPVGTPVTLRLDRALTVRVPISRLSNE